MAEQRHQGGPMVEHRQQFGGQYGQQQQQQQSRSFQVVKATTAVTAGGSLLVLAGLTLAATVIGLTVATPVLVIFSPVLVPAAITVFLILAGFLTSGGLGVAALSVLTWIYKYVTGKHPPGADKLDEASYRLASKARDVRDRAEQFGQQAQTKGREREEQRQQEGPMVEHRQQFGGQYGQQQQQQQSRSFQVVKATTAVTTGGSLLVLAGLTQAATVIGLTVATPVLVIFSPVLVPAAIAVFLIMAGFLTSGGLGAAALSVLTWIYKYLTGKHPPGADKLDEASYKLASKARDVRDRAEQFGQQAQTKGREREGAGGGAQAS